MNDFNLDEYADLAQTSHSAPEPTSPESEFFHSVYIAGITRTNQAGVQEQAGNLQIRGVEYNLQEVNMIIIHVKDVNVKVKKASQGQRESIECFSYKNGSPPFHGTAKLDSGSLRECPANSVERAANDYCSPCRNHLLVAGIYCDKSGTPILTEEKKPIFIFIRGKGMKYKNVSDYLGEMYRLELDPMFTPPTEQSLEFEKKVVNNKRFVTNITIGEEGSQFGPKKVFILTRATQLGNDFVKDVLQVSKKTLSKFNEKFDWSQRKQATSGYGDDKQSGILPADGSDLREPSTQVEKQEPPAQEPQSKPFSFEDVSFD